MKKMRTREKMTLGVLLGLLAILGIGAAFAANDSDTEQYGKGFGPRDGSGQGYGKGGMMRGFANGGDFGGCPMHAALEEQGMTADEFAELHKELFESGNMGPGAMRALLESKGYDTSDFPQPGWRRSQ